MATRHVRALPARRRLTRRRQPSSCSVPGNLTHVHLLASDPARDQQLRQLRDAHPRVPHRRRPTPTPAAETVRLAFRFHLRAQTSFRPPVEITGLRPEEVARMRDADRTAPYPRPGHRGSVQLLEGILQPGHRRRRPRQPTRTRPHGGSRSGPRQWASSSTATASTSPRPASCASPPSPAPTGRGHSQARPPAPTRPTPRPSSCSAAVKTPSPSSTPSATPPRGNRLLPLQPDTGGQRALAESLADGGRIIEVHRTDAPRTARPQRLRPPLNGHTPYSAYLALAALLAGYLRGNRIVARRELPQ